LFFRPKNKRDHRHNAKKLDLTMFHDLSTGSAF
jgi:hypothetical protein